MGKWEAAHPLAPSDPVSCCQFSFILERVNILETSLLPSNGAEGGHGFKRDLGERAAVEGCSQGEKGKGIWEIPVQVKGQ